jgi:hypothetical protein
VPNLTILRVAAPSFATFGVFVRDDTGIPFAVTLERDWDHGSNRPSKGDKPGACIPAGTYTCVRVDSPRFRDTFEVKGVPGRSFILLHKGNLADDSRGCILVGEQFDPVKGAQGITASADGFAEFLTIQTGVQAFTLTIRNVWP